MPVTKHILVVDDEPDILVSVSRLLIRQGYAVTPMDSADKALAYLKAGRPCDLIVLDLMMPGMPGLLFLRLLRTDLRSKVPVILLTARSTLHDVADGYNRGAEFYVTKPCQPGTLLKAVDFFVADLSVEERTQLEAELETCENVYYASSKAMYR